MILWGLLSSALLLFVLFFRLANFPGIHFDEAWAANFAARIAGEQGFWPREAMSPYTSAWAHYVSALFFHFFGVNLTVYRASQLFMSLAGIALLTLAVKKRYGNRAAWLVPTAVFSLPGLFLNQRFGIEINSFHVLIFGWFTFALVTGQRWQAALAILFGVTSHVLFFSVGVAFVAFLVLARKKLRPQDRLWIVGTALVFIPFFAQLLARIPETGKVLALLAVIGFVVVMFATPLFSWFAKTVEKIGAHFDRHKKILIAAFFILAIPIWLPLIVFAEGHWTVLAYKGAFQFAPLFGLGFLAVVPAVYLGGKAAWRRGDALFFFLLLVFIGAIIPKATPRYFEIPMLGLGVFAAVGWAEMKGGALRRVTIGFAVTMSLVLFLHQLLPGETREKKFHFLFLKDESGDFLSKQRVVAELGLRGCRLSDIRIADFRGGEGLRFLARGDWPVAEKPCEWPQAIVRRASQPVHAPEVLLRTSGYVIER